MNGLIQGTIVTDYFSRDGISLVIDLSTSRHLRIWELAHSLVLCYQNG